jgi:phage recombination protein Bet
MNDLFLRGLKMNQLTTTLGSQLQNFQKDLSEQQLQVLKSTLCKDASDVEMQLFSQICKRTGLDPFARQIYMVKRQGQVTFQTSIDGFRIIAERSGVYAGQEDVVYFDREGNKYEIWTKEEPPYAARAGVIKKGFTHPIRAIAIYHEYKPAQGDFMWKKMPSLMIGKCAEALALRKAFSNDLSGIYTNDEMAQASNLDKKDPVVVNVDHNESVHGNIVKKIATLVGNPPNQNRLDYLRHMYKFVSRDDVFKWDAYKVDSVWGDLKDLTCELIDKMIETQISFKD